MINFFAAGRNRELLKNAKPDDLIVLGYYTPNKNKLGTQPEIRAIKVKDFLAGAFADIDAQVLEIGGEGDELVLTGGSIDGVPIPDSVIPMEQIAQGFRLQDVSDVDPYSGNADKFLKVNASGNDVEWVDAPSVINPTLNLRCNFGVVPSLQVLHNGSGFTGITISRSATGQFQVSWNEDLIDEESTQVLVTSAGSPSFEQCVITSILPNSVSFKVATLGGSPVDSGQFYIEIKEFPL